jgi:hypothetical protein
MAANPRMQPTGRSGRQHEGPQLMRKSLAASTRVPERSRCLEPSRELVQQLAQRLFPGVQEAIVLEILDRYGIESYERERDRVQVAILKLSNGDLERLKTMVSHAKMDYRDTLAAAEYPGEFRAYLGVELPPAEKERIRQEDRRQHLEWLRMHTT